jgi:dTDP-glucose 4,6-dehydratase
MKRVLLTGIGGSIGIHVLGHIMHNTDWDVVGIDSFRHKGWADRLSLTFGDHPDWQERTTIVTHDLVSPFSDLMKKKIGQFDYILHLASLSDVDLSIEDPVPFIRNNVDCTLSVLEFARETKPEAFVLFSTDEVYGASGEHQAHPEWSTILPSNPYSASKAAQEAISISYWRTYDVPVIITNTMNNFGEMQQSNKFPAMIQRKVENNEVVQIHGKEGDIGSRYYLHSRNAADALLFILKNCPAYHHEPGSIDRPDRYNIVGDKRLNNLELATIIAKLMNKEFRFELVDFHATRPGHDKHYGLDGKKLADLGWKPPVSFEDSLGETINWQQEHKEWL